MAVELEARVREALGAHPAVSSVELVGSRAQGRETMLSDWDFLVKVDVFAEVRETLSDLVAPLQPIVEQWDRLSEEASYYMLLLPGGVKVDLVFDVPPVLEPPWEVRAETLPALDAHFWDWILWLGGKQLAGDDRLVRITLDRLMYEHLLRPVGLAEPPATIAEAIERYRAARSECERELGVQVPRAAEEAVLPRLLAARVA
jgi:predicted nucleotidyltransferase